MDLYPLLATFTYKHTRWLIQIAWGAQTQPAAQTPRFATLEALWTEAESTSCQVRIPVGGAAASVTTLCGATG
jgi:hypothetical protein